MCRAFLNGYCKFGARCKFKHPQQNGKPGNKAIMDLPASALHNTQVYRRCKLPLQLSISDYCCYPRQREETG